MLGGETCDAVLPLISGCNRLPEITRIDSMGSHGNHGISEHFAPRHPGYQSIPMDTSDVMGHMGPQTTLFYISSSFTREKHIPTSRKIDTLQEM